MCAARVSQVQNAFLQSLLEHFSLAMPAFNEKELHNCETTFHNFTEKCTFFIYISLIKSLKIIRGLIRVIPTLKNNTGTGDLQQTQLVCTSCSSC